MSDLGDDFRAMREHSQGKRAANRSSSAALLAARCVPFTSHNDGAHLIVGDPPKADLWPGTGLWIIRGGRKGRGVGRLLTALGRGHLR